jgi:hypothetical protein
VKWGFVQEVLVKKGFPDLWIKQVMSIIQGGKVCVNVNEDRTPYFKTYKELRQGNTLSPILFNLVAEVLAIPMRRVAELCKVRGVLPHVLPRGITHSQYADDTILMIEGGDDSAINIKFALYCFEWLSGLKINYHKSDTYFFG